MILPFILVYYPLFPCFQALAHLLIFIFNEIGAYNCSKEIFVVVLNVRLEETLNPSCNRARAPSQSPLTSHLQWHNHLIRSYRLSFAGENWRQSNLLFADSSDGIAICLVSSNISSPATQIVENPELELIARGKEEKN